MILTFPRGLDHFVYDMSRRGLVGIAHSEVDDILATMPRFQLQALYLSEHVGREPLEPVKII